MSHTETSSSASLNPKNPLTIQSNLSYWSPLLSSQSECFQTFKNHYLAAPCFKQTVTVFAFCEWLVNTGLTADQQKLE